MIRLNHFVALIHVGDSSRELLKQALFYPRFNLGQDVPSINLKVLNRTLSESFSNRHSLSGRPVGMLRAHRPPNSVAGELTDEITQLPGIVLCVDMHRFLHANHALGGRTHLFVIF